MYVPALPTVGALVDLFITHHIEGLGIARENGHRVKDFGIRWKGCLLPAGGMVGRSIKL